MACFKPLVGYRSRTVNPTGKRSIVFDRNKSNDERVELSCGQCIGCRLNRSKNWAIRIQHEASLHEDNCFITLTYAPEHLPPLGSLRLRDFQLFMKRLRKEFGAGIRFFHCGEYGERGGRPHYHAIIFGLNFPDRKLRYTTELGHKCYSSEILDRLWGLGRTEIGSVTFESAAYVARYITKKIGGLDAEAHYQVVDDKWGEVLGSRVPEYVTMSRRPGIGKRWIDQYWSDVYPHDRVQMRGKDLVPPKYYDSQFGVAFPEEFEDVKFKRIQRGRIRSGEENRVDREALLGALRRGDPIPLRRAEVRELVQIKKMEFLKRRYEDES